MLLPMEAAMLSSRREMPSPSVGSFAPPRSTVPYTPTKPARTEWSHGRPPIVSVSRAMNANGMHNKTYTPNASDKKGPRRMRPTSTDFSSTTTINTFAKQAKIVVQAVSNASPFAPANPTKEARKVSAAGHPDALTQCANPGDSSAIVMISTLTAVTRIKSDKLILPRLIECLCRFDCWSCPVYPSSQERADYGVQNA